MPKRLRPFLLLFAVLGLAFLGGCDSAPESKPETTNNASGHPADESLAHGKRLTRLFWQDRDQSIVKSGDLYLNGGSYELVECELAGFPEVKEDSDLVQMALAGDRLIVGVRDANGGADASGWVEIATGVEEESHGDHSHWHYPRDPKVVFSEVDDTQGNPAHVYQYGKCVYIANDKKNGFTKVTPNPKSGAPSDAKFFLGGGGHITLAAVGDKIAYSSWIDRQGENAGRVDVVDLRGDASKPAYSFTLPSGGIHGAAACGNRVFFAPSDGVCWVDCDFDFVLNRDKVDVHSISLGQDDDGQSYRTGAFYAFKNHLLCIANAKSGTPYVGIIDGTTPDPGLTKVSIDGLVDGMKVATVKATMVSRNQVRAYMFGESSDSNDKMFIVDLDPDANRDYSDAEVVGSVEVGNNQLEGHFGHHGLAFVDGQKLAVVSNPGDGTLSIVNLEQEKVVETISVGGQPTHIVAFGGQH